MKSFLRCTHSVVTIFIYTSLQHVLEYDIIITSIAISTLAPVSKGIVSFFFGIEDRRDIFNKNLRLGTQVLSFVVFVIEDLSRKKPKYYWKILPYVDIEKVVSHMLLS